MIVTAILTGVMIYLSGVLSNVIRKGLMRHIHYRYLHDKTFYETCCTDGRVDNPDQRITEDVRFFSQSFTNLLFGTVQVGGCVSLVRIHLSRLLVPDWRMLHQFFQVGGMTIVTWRYITWIGVTMAFGVAILAFFFTRHFTSPVVALVFRLVLCPCS